MNFFLRDGDEQRAQSAVFMDDIDLIYSKTQATAAGPKLVAVAVRHVNGMSVHVCQCCGEGFDEKTPKLAPAEVNMGSAIMLLHAHCVNKRTRSSFRSFADITRGMQGRRFFAKATKPFDRASGE